MMVLALIGLFAADPVVIAAGAGVAFGTPVDVSTMHAYEPAVAAGGTELVVAWYATTTTKPGESRSCVYAKQGGGAQVEIECGTITNKPVVAATAGGALVVYGSGSHLVGARLAKGKVAKKHTFKIASKMTIGLAVGWDGVRYWLAYGDGKDAFVQRVSTAGALVGRAEKLAGESPRSGNLHVLCGARCQLLTQRGSRSLTGNKLGTLAQVSIDPLWKVTMPTFATKPFFGANRHRSMPAAKDIVGAETTAGALAAWTRREKPGQRLFELAFVPADPTHARHTPVPFTDEIDPVIVAIDDTHFGLVTSTVGGGNHLVARVITIDPAYFAAVPASRPAMASGHVTGANGKPAAGAQVHYRAVFANGTQRTSTGVAAGSDGAYTIPHPAPDDHDTGQDVVRIEVWANSGEDTSEVKVAGSGALDLALRAAAKLALVLDGVKGVTATVKLEHHEDISTLRDRHVSWQKTIDVRDKIDLADIPAGKLEITVRSKDGRGAFLATTIAPGKPNAIRLPLGRLGSLVVSLESKQPLDQPITVVQGEELRDLNHDRSRIVELKELTPGVHDIVFVSMPWQMTRRHTVRPRATDQVKLTFEADLPPGYVGLQVTSSLTIDAIAPGSPAETAGAYVGARIDLIDGTAPTDAAHARQLLRGTPGSTVTVELGGGPKRTLSIKRSSGTGAHAPGGPPPLLGP